MLKIVGNDTFGGPLSEVVLFDHFNRPTPTFIGLVAIEIAFDCLVGYAAYRLFKASQKKKEAQEAQAIQENM